MNESAMPGKIVLVREIPACNFNSDHGDGMYDFRVKGISSWANGCQACWEKYRAYSELGVGKGQLWVIGNE